MIQFNSGIAAFSGRQHVNVHPQKNRQETIEEFGQMIEKKRGELDARKTGDYKPKMPTGAGSYSEDGWNRMMENFDSVQEGIRAEIDQRLEDFQLESESA